MIDLKQNSLISAAPAKDYYPEISVPIKGMKKITPDMMDKDIEVTCVLRPCGLDKEKVRFEVRSVGLDKSKAKSIDEVIDNAAEDAEDEKDDQDDQGEEEKD